MIAGYPAIFVRVSGCSRSCTFCDSKYHKNGIVMSNKQIIKKIKKLLPSQLIVFTGGECLLQWKKLKKLLLHKDFVVIVQKNNLKIYLETNGDYIKNIHDLEELDRYFKVINVSPKSLNIAQRIAKLIDSSLSCIGIKFNIKIVTDGDNLNKKLISYATMLMPLTTYDEEKDKKIAKKVWNLCVKKNLRYSPRLHVELFGKRRKI